MSDEQRLAKIRARVEAATPGPWKSECEGDLVTAGPLSFTLADFAWRRKPNPADAPFVAHARDDVPYLLTLVADLQRVVADLCEESDAAAEALRYRRALEEIADVAWPAAFDGDREAQAILRLVRLAGGSSISRQW